jgi:hypothetical protein
MPNPNFYRQIARQCRDLLKITTKPELFAQLETWERVAMSSERRNTGVWPIRRRIPKPAPRSAISRKLTRGGG